jgi:hypothetical protein
MITKKIVLQIIGFTVVVVLVIIVGKAFWPVESAPLAESRVDTEQMGQKGAGELQAPVEAPPLDEKQAAEPAWAEQPKMIAEKKSDPRAERLYQLALSRRQTSISSDTDYTTTPAAERLSRTALSQTHASSPSETDYKTISDCCQMILTEYPDSVQAEKARRLLQEVPQQYRQQYDKQMSLIYPRKPKVKRSKVLRRRMPRRYIEVEKTFGEETSDSD